MIARRLLMTAGALGLAGLSVAAHAQSPDMTKLRDELMALEKASWGYMKDRNLDGMRGYLADDGLLIFADGSRFNKRTRAEHESTTQLDGRQCPRHRVRVGRPVHQGSGSTVCSCSMHPSAFKCSVLKVRRPAARGVPIWMIMHRS